MHTVCLSCSIRVTSGLDCPEGSKDYTYSLYEMTDTLKKFRKQLVVVGYI